MTLKKSQFCDALNEAREATLSFLVYFDVTPL